MGAYEFEWIPATCVCARERRYVIRLVCARALVCPFRIFDMVCSSTHPIRTSSPPDQRSAIPARVGELGRRPRCGAVCGAHTLSAVIYNHALRLLCVRESGRFGGGAGGPRKDGRALRDDKCIREIRCLYQFNHSIGMAINIYGEPHMHGTHTHTHTRPCIHSTDVELTELYITYFPHAGTDAARHTQAHTITHQPAHARQ